MRKHLIESSTVEIDGKEYRLGYDYNAIAEAEKAAGCNLLSGLDSLANLSALQLRGLFYAAMTPFDKKITVEQAGDLIRLNTIAKITAAMAEAYTLSMPKGKTPGEDSAAAVKEEIPDPEPARPPNYVPTL